MRQRWIVLGVMGFVLTAGVWSEPFEMEYDPQEGGLWAWVKLGTMVNGWCDYDGKVNAEQTYTDDGRTIFYGWTDADVARLGGGAGRLLPNITMILIRRLKICIWRTREGRWG